MDSKTRKKMEVARHLLPAPGPEVVGQLLDELDRAREAGAREVLGKLREIRKAVGSEHADQVVGILVNSRDPISAIDDEYNRMGLGKKEESTNAP